MPAENESSMMSCTNRKTSGTARRSIPERLFRPWALALIGLAISVALGGFGYRISRYKLHPDANSRALFAKLWDKHQDVTQLAAANGTSKQPAQFQVALHAALLLLSENHGQDQYAFSSPDNCKQIPAFFQSVVPLRSPPSRNSAV